MNTSPFFSVIIPLYNKEQYIYNTIESVLQQSFSDYEVIVVNDGSTDKSLDVVHLFNDSKLRIFDIQNNGVSHARNFGIQQAKGEYIAFLDADDVWFKYKLEKQHKLLVENNMLYWCSGNYIKDSGEKIEFKSSNQIIKETIEALNHGLSLLTSTMVVKKSVFDDNLFKFDEAHNTSEDIEVWYKLGLFYPELGYIDDGFLMKYTTDDNDSLTKSAFNKSDYSILTLKKRIDESLKSTIKSKKQLDTFLIKSSRRYILQGWFWSPNFGKDYRLHREIFLYYYNQYILSFLLQTSGSPRMVKRLLYKLLKFCFVDKK